VTTLVVSLMAALTVAVVYAVALRLHIARLRANLAGARRDLTACRLRLLDRRADWPAWEQRMRSRR
jgi:hypothetical protein